MIFGHSLIGIHSDNKLSVRCKYPGRHLQPILHNSSQKSGGIGFSHDRKHADAHVLNT